MSELAARAILIATGLYLGLGLAFAAAFLPLGVARIDPAARGSSIAFRIAILPGVCALWPLLAHRWLRGDAAPPDEVDAHVRAAREAAR